VAPLAAGTVPATVAGTVPAAVVPGKDAVLASLKEELFALETDRLQGKVSEQEYGDVKVSIETVLRRVLSRS
jgi:hypothetical protein